MLWCTQNSPFQTFPLLISTIFIGMLITGVAPTFTSFAEHHPSRVPDSYLSHQVHKNFTIQFQFFRLHVSPRTQCPPGERGQPLCGLRLGWPCYCGAAKHSRDAAAVAERKVPS